MVGALVVGNRSETKSISGKECDCITLTAKLDKLSLMRKKLLLFSGRFSSMPNVDPYVDAMKSYSEKLCLLPSGMVLDSEMNLGFDADGLPPDGVVSSYILSTMTDYEVNSVIPDSFSDLPQQYKPFKSPEYAAWVTFACFVT